jgi:hypothetical protein
VALIIIIIIYRLLLFYCYFPEDGHHSHCRGNLKSYMCYSYHQIRGHEIGFCVLLPCYLTAVTCCQGVGKIMETLRNLGIEFVLATLKEPLATLSVLPFIYTL